MPTKDILLACKVLGYLRVHVYLWFRLCGTSKNSGSTDRPLTLLSPRGAEGPHGPSRTQAKRRGLAGIRCHAREVNDLFTNTRLSPARIRLPFNAYTHDDDQAKPVTMRVTEIIIDVCCIPLPQLKYS